MEALVEGTPWSAPVKAAWVAGLAKEAAEWEVLEEPYPELIWPIGG